MPLTEDDIYRSSTQYKHWTFTPAGLAAQRLQTNQRAAERVRAAVARRRAQRAPGPDAASTPHSNSETGNNTPVPGAESAAKTTSASQIPASEVQCLTPPEESLLLSTFSSRALQLGSFLNFPIEISATAIQYLRRFYLLNSPMTYDPQQITRSIMFIAAKVEGAPPDIGEYASKLPKTSTEDVLAPEFLVMQGLRWCLDVRHPFRGLKGGHLEMVAMAMGRYAVPPSAAKGETEDGDAQDGQQNPTLDPATLQQRMQRLPHTPSGPASNMTTDQLIARLTTAYSFASSILKTAALLTDAYFLYSPSHIWLSAHLLADAPITLFYLSTKTAPSSPTHKKLIRTLHASGALLASHTSFPTPAPPASCLHSEEFEKDPAASQPLTPEQEKAETSRLLKKLKACRDPDKLDLAKLRGGEGGGKKREGGGDVEGEGEKAKKRKLERDGFAKASSEFWGPQLGDQKRREGA